MRIPWYNVIGLVCIAGVLTGIVLTWDHHKSRFRFNSERNRAELIQLHDQFALGMSAEDATKVVERYRSSHLRMFLDRGSEWYIITPSEIGASNWDLRVQFVDGRISATRVRTADGDSYRPPGAPPDRGIWLSSER
jgi:hypothetical protein